MHLWEKALVALFLAVAVPVSLFVVGWWGAAILSMSGAYRLTDAGIAVAAGIGLLAGIALVILRLRTWVAGFYRAGLLVALPLYLSWTAIATAWFMGLPFGNLALGSLAGAYAGRRCAHAGVSRQQGARTATLCAAFAACVTATAALGIGLLAMREPYTLAFARSLLGTDRYLSESAADAVIVAAAVAGLLVLQFALTRLVAEAALRLPTTTAGGPA